MGRLVSIEKNKTANETQPGQSGAVLATGASGGKLVRVGNPRSNSAPNTSQNGAVLATGASGGKLVKVGNDIFEPKAALSSGSTTMVTPGASQGEKRENRVNTDDYLRARRELDSAMRQVTKTGDFDALEQARQRVAELEGDKAGNRTVLDEIKTRLAMTGQDITDFAENFFSGAGHQVLGQVSALDEAVAESPVGKAARTAADWLHDKTEWEIFNVQDVSDIYGKDSALENQAAADILEQTTRGRGALGSQFMQTGQAAGNMMLWSGILGPASEAMKAAGVTDALSGAANGSNALGASAMQKVGSSVSRAGARFALELINNPGNLGISVGSGASSYSLARDNGASPKQAFTNGLLKGLTEYFSNKLFSGTPFEDSGEKGYVTMLTERIADRLGQSGALERLAQSAGGQVMGWLADKSGEGLEEVVTGIADPLIDRLTYDPETDLATADELVDEFVGGVFLSLLMSGGEAIISNIGDSGDTSAENDLFQNQRKAAQQNAPAPAVAAETSVDAQASIDAAGAQNGAQGNSRGIETQKTAPTEGVEPVHVGRATTIYNPYNGTTPMQTSSGGQTSVVPERAIAHARENIQRAQIAAIPTNGSGFKTFLTQLYQQTFQRSSGVLVEGLTYEGKPYLVEIGKKVPGKVISDQNISAEKLALLDVLPHVVQNATYVGSGRYIPKGKKSRPVTRYDYFETPVNISGEDYIARFDVEVLPDTNNYRTHQIVNVDLTTPRGSLVGPVPTAALGGSSPHNNVADSYISQNQNGVNTGYAENGENMRDALTERTAAVNETGGNSVKSGEVSGHIDNRSMANMGDRRVKAFSFDHPELHGYFAQAAQVLINDAENNAAHRGVVGQSYQQQDSTLLRKAKAEGYSNNEIIDAAQRIIADSGQENVAAAKRVELILDEMLTNGYTTSYGEKIAPNVDYINAKAVIPGGSSEVELRIRQLEQEWEFIDNIEGEPSAETLAEREAERAAIRARYAQPEQVNGLPRGTGAAEAGFNTTSGEQVQTQNNAIVKNPMLTNEEQLRFAPGAHERVTAEISKERAGKLFYTDAEGNTVNLAETINGLLEKEMWTGEEQDAAQLALGMLLKEARETGDYSKTETLVQAIERVGTETGRSLQARQKWARFLRSMTPEGRLFMIERSVEQFRKRNNIQTEVKISDELKNRFLNAETEDARDAVIKEMQKEVGKQLPSTALEKWNALRYVNMLGNFKTQIRNLSGNVAMKGITAAKDAVATGIETIASKVSGGRIERTKALNPGKELRAAAKADFQIVKDIASGESRYSINEGKNDTTNFIKGAQEQKTVFKFGDNALTRTLGIENKKGLVLYRTLEAYRKATDFMMNNGIFGDEAFLRASYTHALAGYLKAHNISAEQFTNSDWQSNNADFVDTARAYAIKEAQEATFRDTNVVSAWVSQIARKGKTPKLVRIAGEGLAPFRKTPANVAVRAEEYSPLGLVNTAIMAAQKAAGNADITGADIINQFSKSFTGSAIFAIGMWLKSIGWLRGKDDDDDQEYFDKLVGHQDYALELPGGFSYKLDWLSPVSMPLFMGVEFMDAIQEGGLSAGDLLSAISAGAEAFWDPMLEMSMLSGINDTLESISYSDNKWVRLAVQLGLSYLTQGLSNTLLGQMERISEPNRMATFTNKDDEAGIIPPWLQREIGRFSAKTPGWDYRQREYTNAWGETQSNGNLLTRIIINTLSPGYVSHVDMNDTEKELQRVADQTGDTSIFPGMAQKSFTINGKTVYLTMGEYDEYSKSLGEYRRELYKDILLSPIYKKLSDEDKAGAISKMEGYAGYKGKKETTDEYNGTSEMQAYAKADAAGIDPVEFYTYHSRKNGLTADKDANGKSITGSLKEKVVNVINKMNLTPEEKDYLYLNVEQYGESSLRDMPWHQGG